jgi:hypothetical protein
MTTTTNPDTTDRRTLITHYWTHEYTWLWLRPGLPPALAATYGYRLSSQSGSCPACQPSALFLTSLFSALSRLRPAPLSESCTHSRV